jgi:hypothetical protein
LISSQRAGDGGGDLGVDLVGRDLQQRLVNLDLVADLLEPAGDGALGDGLAERRQRDGSRRRVQAAWLRPGRWARLVLAPSSAGCSSAAVGSARRQRSCLGCPTGPSSDSWGLILAFQHRRVSPRPVTDHGELGADLDGLVLLDQDLQQRAGDGEGISVSTLSVETSSSGSSTATVSPTCLSQRVTVPSVTDSPRGAG